MPMQKAPLVSGRWIARALAALLVAMQPAIAVEGALQDEPDLAELLHAEHRDKVLELLDSRETGSAAALAYLIDRGRSGPGVQTDVRWSLIARDARTMQVELLAAAVELTSFSLQSAHVDSARVELARRSADNAAAGNYTALDVSDPLQQDALDRLVQERARRAHKADGGSYAVLRQLVTAWAAVPFAPDYRDEMRTYWLQSDPDSKVISQLSPEALAMLPMVGMAMALPSQPPLMSQVCSGSDLQARPQRIPHCARLARLAWERGDSLLTRFFGLALLKRLVEAGNDTADAVAFERSYHWRLDSWGALDGFAGHSKRWSDCALRDGATEVECLRQLAQQAGIAAEPAEDWKPLNWAE